MTLQDHWRVGTCEVRSPKLALADKIVLESHRSPTEVYSLNAAAAADHLGSASVGQRRANGQVYTPSHVVEFVLAEAGFVADADIEHKSIWDPACGAGAFLLGAVEALASRLRDLGREDELPEFVEARLFGTDLDDVACSLAREAVRRLVGSLSQRVLRHDYFSGNVVCADFLTSMQGAPPGPVDFIVGNPPYVSIDRMAPQLKEHLRRAYKSATGRIDLYTLFIERSVQMLPAGGRLSFVTPDKFLVSRSSRSLRSLLLEQGAIRSVALFASHKVFQNAATVPCVTVFEKLGVSGPIQVKNCSDSDEHGQRKVNILSSSITTQAILLPQGWHLRTLDRRNLVQRLMSRGTHLADLVQRISSGPATGRDGIYVFPTGSRPEIESELLRPVLRGRDVGAFSIRDPELEMLVPFEFTSGERPRLIDLGKYPGARAYLSAHRAELERRHCVRVWGKAWYDLHDPITFDLATVEKIVLPDVAKTNRFSVESGKYLPLHSAYYITPGRDVDPYFLVAVLNSKVLTYLIGKIAPRVKDGFYRFRRQFLEELPIPSVSSVLQNQIQCAARDHDMAIIDSLVMDAFGMSDMDRAVLEAEIPS